VRSPVPSGLASPTFPARRYSTFQIACTVLFILTFLGSYNLAQVKPLALFEPEGRRNIWKFITNMFPPDLSWNFLSLLGRPILETVQISLMGIVMAVAIGLPLGLLATSSLSFRGIMNEHDRASSSLRSQLRRVIYLVARAVLTLFRTLPEFVWAFMFVRAVGLGPFPGVLAIGISYAGMLGKVYSEILDHVNPGPIEALQATGASRLTILLYGLIPQALPNLASYTLYRWECAIRASAILGFVGAGGLGQQIEISMRMFNFNQVTTLIAILFVMVAGVDALSARIRSVIMGSHASDTETPVRTSGPALPRGRGFLSAINLMIVSGFLALMAWSYAGTEFSLRALLGGESAGQILVYIKKLFPPDLSNDLLLKTGYWSIETFAMSFLGTMLAVLIAFSLVFLSSRNLMFTGLLFEMERSRLWVRIVRTILYLSAKATLNLLRTVPHLVWALILVFAVGLGPFPGMLALGIHTGGVLGRLFGEVMENVETQPIEALQATGASRLQILCYGILPQVLPECAAYTLYRWEVNIREAIILGYVGAGGLGQQIHIAISLFLEHRLLTLIIAIYLIVMIVDALSASLRHRLS